MFFSEKANFSPYTLKKIFTIVKIINTQRKMASDLVN